MKIQRWLIPLFAATFLAMSFVPINYASAEKATEDKIKNKGWILFDFPNPSSEPTVEINLNNKLINLVTKSMSSSPEMAEMVKMLKGMYVRTYRHAEDDMILYYQEKLKTEDWEVLVKVKEKNEVVEIRLLYDEDVVYGIFVIFKSHNEEITFVNIVGEIAPERISELLGNLSKFGMTDIDLEDTLKANAGENINSGKGKELLAVKTATPPKIDGKLDDKCWKTAPQADKFTHIQTNNPVKDQTVAKIVYTDKSIYIAWQLNSSQPKSIVSRQTKDQKRFTDEDVVCFSIDPFHTHQSDHRTLFMANPMGKKYVQFAPGRPKKTELTGKWKVETKIEDNGWMVEMEIPWQILDYPETTEPIEMGINFDRKQQSTSEHSWWSNVGVEKSYNKDGNWLRVLPPSKSSRMQGFLDMFDKDKNRFVRGNNTPPTDRELFRAVNTSGLNPIDGLRLGGGFEIGSRWNADPLFFDRSGETIRRSLYTATPNEHYGSDRGFRSPYLPNPFVYGTMSYALRTESINYRLGGGMTFGESSNLTYSAQIHRFTAVRDRDLLLTGSEQFLRAFVDSDFQDYYTRQGGVMAIQWQNTTLKHTLGLSLLLEEHESISDNSDSYFRIATSSYYIDTHARMNPPIYDGRMHSISLKYDFDNREDTKVRYDLGNRGNKNEWYNTFIVEYSNSAIGSTYDFTRFVVHLRNYHPIGENRLDTRLKIGLSATEYSLPFQRQFVLGGPGTLRGYALYEFVGNHGFLFNLEYLHSLTKGFFIVPFVDIGQAWDNLEDIKPDYPKVNLGIGFQLGIFRLNFARALESHIGYSANFKWSRTF